jgi:hypothetical protein
VINFDPSDIHSLFYIGPRGEVEQGSDDDLCSEVSLNSFECR